MVIAPDAPHGIDSQARTAGQPAADRTVAASGGYVT